MGCKVGGKVFKTKLTRDHVNIEIGLTNADINHFIDIKRGD